MPTRTELIEWLDNQHGYSEEIVDALLARWPHIAGPERVESENILAELWAMPVGTIVECGGGRLWKKVGRDMYGWTGTGRGCTHQPDYFMDDTPLTVLHRPDATNPEEA